ncbi:MAG: NADH:ubiquinone oxidoreductase subunit J [Gammaproteobacteria bacterium RIFCSPHIGHO2_12_FULL_40_19]|nr:MAG: NADH:ubiquinone oxidoreductase subunit J [Gammaproteobacteria bacterium RIFCSPHIGHO2_12_FULL_40_19]
MHQVIFYAFTLLLIASATMVITAKNAVKAVLFLVVAFFASSVLWMLMQAEFLALVLIFVYVGAVMTLFLFVVMMIPPDQSESNQRFFRHYSVGFLALIILVGTAFYAFSAKHWSLANTLPTHYPAQYNNIQAMGMLLFTKYLFPFELSAVLLLVGMISAIALAFNGKKKGTKSQIISEQLKANKQDRLRVVDLK